MVFATKTNRSKGTVFFVLIFDLTDLIDQKNNNKKKKEKKEKTSLKE